MKITQAPGICSSYILGRNADVLARIADPTINLALWMRDKAPAPLSIKEIIDSNFRESQVVFECGESIEAIGVWLDEVLDLQSSDAYRFYFDIMNLVEYFITISKERVIGVRLEKVKSDNCKSFHTDFLSLRLLCTYWGPGTEYLDNSNANREGLKKNRNDLVVKDARKIKRFGRNWVGILKGEKYEDNLGNAVIHRSPEISHDETLTRLVLRIDSLERFGV
jgi:hypothetical protein